MSKKLFIKSYGCQMNVYDAERMADVMDGEGYELTDSPDNADLVILNTCHIREKAAEKVYSDVGRLRQLKDNRRDKGGKDMTVAVAGCVAQAEGGEMIRRAPTIDMVVGPQAYHRLPDMVGKTLDAKSKGTKARLVDTDMPIDSKFDHLPNVKRKASPSAFLTVQEGCDKFCTFCVVPYTRGAEFSRSVDEIMAEANKLSSEGVRELTLLGQNVNAFHGTTADGKEVSLGKLIRMMAEIDGLERIRYTTSHPRDMSQELLDAHREIEKCMPYLHLPVQSGSNKILEAMNRKHDRDVYFRCIDQLREARPDIALSGDFIVGFPGETDQDFRDTMDLVERVGYASAYSFKYSPRPGTPAATSEEQVEEAVKAERLQALQELLNKQQREFNESVIDRTFDVLFERPGKMEGQLIGRSPYLQSVHVDVSNANSGLDASSPATYTDLIGKMVSVKVVSAGPNSLKGEMVGQPR